MAQHTVRVNIPAHEYDVLVEPGLLTSVGQHLRRLSKSAKAGLVTDSHVGPLYAAVVQRSLESAGFEVVPLIIPAGEQHKTLQTIATIYDRMLSFGVERSTPLVALGGGVVGDMTGFAAATILRGIPFLQIPTTLLSMVDASVGGKTGIDHAVGKNLIGAFHQPLGVLIDPAVLRTLLPRELRSGLAECIKHEIIRDPAGFDTLEQNISRALSLDVEYLAELVTHNVAIKARVVEADPFEKAERAHLNLGHTFGHAIETVSNYSFAHGEGVALGMIAASHLAASLGMLDEASVQRIKSLIAAADLPTARVCLDPDRLISTMIYDKKVKSGRIRFILPDRIGHVVIRDDIPPEQVRAAILRLM